MARATANIAEAGLANWVTILEGDALKTLATIDAPVEFVLLDGWKNLYLPVLHLLEPRLTPGALVIADDTISLAHEMGNYLGYVRDPANGYLSLLFPDATACDLPRLTQPADVPSCRLWPARCSIVPVGRAGLGGCWHLSPGEAVQRGQGAYFCTRAPTCGSAAVTCLPALPRTLPYALTIVGRSEAAARASVTESRASDTSSPRLAR